jgi:hypothetical protein
MTTTPHERMVLSDLAGATRDVRPADERVHRSDPDDPMWGETSWWVLTSPKHALIGWVYILVRPNLRVASCGIWFWDSSAGDPWEIRHSTNYSHIQLDDGFDMDRIHWDAHGVEVECIEPFTAHRIALDLEGLRADLSVTATWPPNPVGIGETTGHLDQALSVNGSVELDGTRYEFEGPAFRDRTWSSRAETHHRTANCYTWASDPAASFQLLGMLDGELGTNIVGGLLAVDGRLSPMKSATRTVTSRDARGAPTGLSLTIIDSLDRSLAATGECVSTAALPGFAGYFTWATLVRWTLDNGMVVWGEDHDSWPHSIWRAQRKHLATTTPLATSI